MNEYKEVSDLKSEVRELSVMLNDLMAFLGFIEQAIDEIPDGIFIYDYIQERVFVNDQFVRFAGFTSKLEIDDIIHSGKDLFENTHIPFSFKEIIGKLESRKSVTKEFSYYSKNEETFFFEIYVSSIYSKENAPAGYFIILKDITRRKYALIEEKENSTFLELIIDSVPVPIFYKNKAGKFLLVNKAYESFTGMNKQKILGKTVSDIYPEKYAKRLESEEKSLYREKSIHKFETGILHPDETLHTINVTQALYYGPDDNIKGTLGTWQDITELKFKEFSIRYRHNFEKILLEISSSLINISPDEVDTMIDESLQKIVTFTGVEEGFLFQLTESGKYISMTHLFRKGKSSDIRKNLQNVFFDDTPYFKDMLMGNEVVSISNIEYLPEKAVPEKEILQRNDVKSMIMVPLWFNNELIGNLGLSSLHEIRQWTNDESLLLRFAGEIFIRALDRKKNIKDILYRDNILQTITQNLEIFLTDISADTNMNRILASLGECMSVNRTFLGLITFENNAAYMDYRYEWHDENVPSMLGNAGLKKLDMMNSPLDGLYKEFYTGDLVHITIDKLDAETRSFFEKYQTKSIVIMPVLVHNKYWGALGLTDNFNPTRKWLEIERESLKIVARFIGLSVEREMALKSLSEEEEKFRNIFEQSRDPIVITDLNGKILLANDVFRMACFSISDSWDNKPDICNFIEKDSRRKFITGIKNLTYDRNSATSECNFVCTTGEIRTFEINNQLIDFNNRQAILIIMRDITERKGMEKKLLETVIQTEEKERQRFGEDLHDELGPLLSGIKLYISELGTGSSHAQHRKVITAYLGEMVDEAVKKIRALSNNLMPNVLIDYGLEKGLEAFISKLNLIQDAKIELNFTNENKTLETTLEIIIYRIMIELINNSIKHSRSTKINIDIQIQSNNIQMMYADNGIGFNLVSELELKSGIGLSSLLNRLASIHGEYKFSSKPNKGMKFEFSIPRNN